MKKTLAAALCLALLLALAAPAAAETIQSRAVIGADLDAGQIASVYRSFGLRRGDVIELRLTNAEERRYLEHFVDSRLIGTRSISCVYVELLPAGSGMSVTTENVTWCSGQMYVSALTTAGVSNARIRVTAPFAVSGTAALAGIYKAYEDMTGSSLDDLAKQVGTQELTVTGELAQQIGSFDSASIVSELKLMLDKTVKLGDEELRGLIRSVAERYRVSLTDTQLGQLVELCRSLEKLNPDQLKQRVEQVQGTLQRVSEVKEKAEGFAQTLKEIWDSVGGFFDTVGELIDKLL